MYSNASKINGLVWGVVTDNKHPDGHYMVKAKLPWIVDSEGGDKSDFMTPWLRVLTPMAGAKRGIYFFPEIGDEVAISFVHGNINEGVVVGSVWNATDKAPHGGEMPADSTDPMGNPAGIADSATDTTDGNNHFKGIITREGSVVGIDDTPGKEKLIFKTKKGSTLMVNDEKDCVSLYDHKGEVYLHLDQAGKKITLESKEGDIDIFCKKGTLNIEAKDIKTKATNTQDHKADKSWKQESGTTMDLKAGGTMTLKGGPKIDLNP